MLDQCTNPRPTCLTCGAAFSPTPVQIRNGSFKYCGQACYYGRRPDLVAHFWTKAAKSPDPDGCWLWTGYVGRYGQFPIDHARTIAAHRFAYEATYGPVPVNLQVLHRCDNPPCVRPDHLFVGTHQDNMDDKVAKGRQATGARTKPENRAKGDQNGSRLHPERLKRGSESPNAKITEDQVRTIRARYAAGGVTQTQLAAEYGVVHSVIGRVVRRQQWRHVS